LLNDYFSEAPTYGPSFFRRRFRMACSMFIVQDVEQHGSYFVQIRDINGRLDLSCLQKIIATYMIISHEFSADFVDHYICERAYRPLN
ncbi:hypothetical protein BAE44_0019701, partial [Dichanthelium oligosanthes]